MRGGGESTVYPGFHMIKRLNEIRTTLARANAESVGAEVARIGGEVRGEASHF